MLVKLVFSFLLGASSLYTHRSVWSLWQNRRRSAAALSSGSAPSSSPCSSFTQSNPWPSRRRRRSSTPRSEPPDVKCALWMLSAYPVLSQKFGHVLCHRVGVVLDGLDLRVKAKKSSNFLKMFGKPSWSWSSLNADGKAVIKVKMGYF